MRPNLWTVALAGGAGRRLRGVTGSVPKQFWAGHNGRTLLEDTLRRIAPLSAGRRRVTVVDRSHEILVRRLGSGGALGRVVYQPLDRGTAAGVLLGLTTVLAEDPDALVLVTPADHGITDVGPFYRGIRSALSLVSSGMRDIVLFGVEATGPAEDYGWITPAADGLPVVRRCTSVEAFREKPGAAEARQLLASGAVWNTMVLVGRASAVFAECRRQIPDVASVFLGAQQEHADWRFAFLADRYPDMPASDFSRDVVTPARGLGLYTWPASMGWSDLGTPERLVAWQAAASTADEEMPHDKVHKDPGQPECR